MTVPTEHLLALAAILFAIGAFGFFTRRNIIVVLMSIELMLNAANLTFVAGARLHSASGELNLDGTLFTIVWVATTVALYSLAGSKRGIYLLSCYPALALLVG